MLGVATDMNKIMKLSKEKNLKILEDNCESLGAKFDGKYLKDGSRIIDNVRGDRIYEGSSTSQTMVNIRGDRIYPSYTVFYP